MFLISLLFAVAYANTEYVSTPHGKRLKQCVMNFPQGTTVEELPNGKLGVEYADGSSEVITPPDECHEDMARMMKERDIARANGPNAWLDNAGWYPPSKDMSKFTGDYIVPKGSPDRGGCTLYYFIGMQNNGQGPVNILQPVLAYQGSGWTYTSWICCPSNISTTGNTVRASTSEKLGGSIVRVDSSTWDVSGTNAAGQKTDLKQRVGPYKYTWADVTMEQYSYSQCSQSPKGPITFENMKIYNGEGTQITPSWSASGKTMCDGTLKVVSPDKITIEHSG
jgi:hypothetical protein